MARKKLVHIHSNVLNKMPKPADLNVGELAVNNNVDNEFISLKNSNDKVVRFSSDEQLVNWMNRKEVFPVSGNVSVDIANNDSQIIIKNNQYADSATTGADIVNSLGVVIDTSAFALSGGNVTFNSVTVNDISATTINGKDANSLGDITNVVYTPNDELEGGVSGNTLEFVQSGNNNTVSVNLEFDDELNSESVNAVQNKVLNATLAEIEEVTAAALNDLNGRVIVLEEKPDIHLTGGSFSDGTLYLQQNNGPTIEIGGISTGEGADGNNYPTSLEFVCNTNVLTLGRNGMSNLTADLSCLDNGDSIPVSGTVENGVGEQSGNTVINFYNNEGDKLFEINVNDLIIDGMVDSVTIGKAVPSDAPEGSTDQVDCLIIKWNDEAGKGQTNIDLSKIFNPDNYYTKQDIQNNYYTKQDVYTKQEINNALGDDFYPSSVTSSVTDVINGLEDRVGVLEGKTDKYVSSGSFSAGTLTLHMSDNTNVNIPGISTGEGADGNDYVTSGEVNQSDGIIKLTYTNPVITSEEGHVITGLSEYIDSKTSGFVETENDKHVTGGSVNGQGVIIVEQNGVTPNIELSGLSDFIDSRISGLSSTDIQVNGGSVDGQGVITLTRTDSNNPSSIVSSVTVTGLETYINSKISDMSGDTYVSGGTVGADGVITLNNTDSTKNGEITGLADYISNHDKHVTSGNVDDDGIINLVIANETDPVSISGLAEYVDSQKDGNSYVTGGTVDSTTGDITLRRNDGGNAYVTGLAAYVSGITPTIEDIWVDLSGDTMTGTLTIDGTSDGKAYALEVNGNVSVSGDVTATGAMYSSDKRLKENIVTVSVEDIENVKNIGFKAFNFISNKESQKIGVIAQELQDNGLGKLTGVNEAGYLTVDYISLLCLKIAELEKEIKELKKNKA